MELQRFKDFSHTEFHTCMRGNFHSKGTSNIFTVTVSLVVTNSMGACIVR